MAAIAFDPLEYTHELEASGVPRNQAEVHAKAMTATFLHNFDALVTRDYLDTRFTEFETRVEANMDKRFAESNTKMDKRFAEIETKTDKRFAEFQLEMHGEIGGVRGDLAELRGTLKLQSWILGVLIVTMLLSVLQRLLV